MIGIVVVSHSRRLADAAIDLARQMVRGGDPVVAVAAGDAEGGLGTDAAAVAAAIEEAASPEGVLVLMDLGSAVMSAQLAIELAAPSYPVHLSSGPLVEGLVVALVRAAGGADLATVAAEAEAGLLPKQTLLGR